MDSDRFRRPADASARLAAIADASADPLVVVDPSGTVLYANSASERSLALSVTDWIGRSALELVHPDDRELALESLAVMDAAPGEVGNPIDLRIRTGNGAYLFMELVGTSRVDDPRIGGVVLNLRDISRRRAAEAGREAAEHLAHHTFDTNPLGLALCTLSGRFVRVNQAMCDMVGLTRSSLLADSYQDRTDAAELAAETAALERLLAGTVDSYTVEKRIVRPDGGVTWAELTVSLVEDPGTGERLIFGQLRDISEQKALREELAARSLQDPLTGLANRTLFEDRVAHALELHRRSGDGFAVLFIDIDDLKAVNDELGHAAGDQLLCTIGDRLRARFRAIDTVARIGGDEFAVLILNVSSPADAHDRCDEVLALVGQPVALEHREILAHASVGLATVPFGEIDDRDGRQLLADADLAMYEAKLAGKRRWRAFDPSMRSAATDRAEVREALRAGVDDGAVELSFQPVVELATGRPAGLEARVGWRHPLRGLLNPAQFLAIAEETGASIELGRQVRDVISACRQDWLAGGHPLADLPIAVNVSARELVDPSLEERFADLIEAGGFPTGHLIIEVAEPAIEADVERAETAIAALHDIGVRLVLDDFGAGRASITYLSRLRADFLKLEPRLVAELVGAGGDDRLLRAVVALCDELEVATIAEGIEDPEQADRVAALGVALGQGHLFGPPLPPADLSRIFDRPVSAGS